MSAHTPTREELAKREYDRGLAAGRAQRDDLLAALKWALPFAERYENTFPGGPRQKLMEAKLVEVRAAIARAEGR